MLQATASDKRKTRRKLQKRLAGKPTVGEPLALAFVPPADVETLNVFYCRHPPVIAPIAGDTMALAALWPPPASETQPASRITFSIGEGEGELYMPRALVETWLIRADPVVLLSRLLPGHAALLLESFLEQELDWLEERLGCRIVVKALENADAPPDGPPFAFTVRIGDDLFTCGFRLDDPDYAARIGRLLKRMGPEAPLPSILPIPICLWRGAVKISIGELQGLRPGDVVLLDDVHGEAATALLVVGGSLVAPVEITNMAGQLIARPSPVKGSKWEWIMDQTKHPDAAQTLEDSDLEELPVTLVFELGRTSMSLGEVKQLAPGAVVPLSDLKDAMVEVIANGKRVGRGEIVRIGESLGVRVVRIFDNA